MSAPLLLPVLLGSAALAAPLTPQEVPSPRANSSWVADLADVVDEEQTQQLDHSIGALNAELGAEIAVVTVHEVQGSPKEFATELFNLWGVGDKEANNGVLVLLVVDARRVEIETGYGVEGILPDGWLGRMMDEAMVPRFKEGALGEGLVAGTEAVADRLRQYPEETRLGTGSAVDIGVEEVDIFPRGFVGAAVATGLATPVLLLGGIALFRRRERQCPVCHQEMELLSEVADDEHLNAGQRHEEELGSKDYRVRVCHEHEVVKIVSRSKWFSGYSTCSKCGYKTSLRKSKTLRAATYTHGGKVRVTETCAHCGHHSTHTYTTARRTRSSSSGSSGGSSFGGGGSSFGGGSSGGGGAGRSW